MRALLPVTLVTGFLGSGKTTLIYRLASARHRERIGAIVGDVVDSAIDAASTIPSRCSTRCNAMPAACTLTR